VIAGFSDEYVTVGFNFGGWNDQGLNARWSSRTAGPVELGEDKKLNINDKPGVICSRFLFSKLTEWNPRNIATIKGRAIALVGHGQGFWA
jgi:hypothetical protein